jgi:hypothetical protein
MSNDFFFIHRSVYFLHKGGSMKDAQAVRIHNIECNFISKGLKNKGVISKNAILKAYHCTLVYIDIAVFL